MVTRSATFLIVSLVVGLLLSQETALAESVGGTSVTCVQPGGISYKRTFDRYLSEDEEADIERAYPKAMCIFLKPATDTPLPAASFDVGDEGLAAALSIISQGDIGEAYPSGINEIIREQPASELEGLRDLAIGVYKMVAVEDILAHWKKISSTSMELAAQIPSIKTRNGISLLSLKAVPRQEVPRVCNLLSERGLNCITEF